VVRTWIIEKIAGDGVLLTRRISTAGGQVTQFAVALRAGVVRPKYACARCGRDLVGDRKNPELVGWVNVPNGKNNRIAGTLCTGCFDETCGFVF
jgi:hypothetical protein